MNLHLLIIIILFIKSQRSNSNKITTNPSSKKYKYAMPLFWKIANKREIGAIKPKRFIFNDYPIALYKDTSNQVKAISDICVHRGASLSHGKIVKGCVQCPYHGWTYKDG